MRMQKKRGEALKEIASGEPVDVGERKIDFAGLKEINPDIVGWLYLPQIGVDGPILTGETDETYLARDFEGNASELGSIFTFADAKLSDRQVYLFAHNMASGQMFGSLKKFQDPGFRKKYPDGCLYTPERTKRFRITGWEYKTADDPCFSVREQKRRCRYRVCDLCWILSDNATAGGACRNYGRTAGFLKQHILKAGERKLQWKNKGGRQYEAEKEDSSCRKSCAACVLAVSVSSESEEDFLGSSGKGRCSWKKQNLPENKQEYKEENRQEEAAAEQKEQSTETGTEKDVPNVPAPKTGDSWWK